MNVHLCWARRRRAFARGGVAWLVCLLAFASGCGDNTGSAKQQGDPGAGGADASDDTALAPGDASPLGDGGGQGGSDADGPALVDLVHALAVTDVAIYQAVKLSLVKDGQPVTKLDTPLIQGRAALLRVFVTPVAGWQPRRVLARLSWGSLPPKDVIATIGGASTDASLETTLNFSLPASDLAAPQLAWSVALLDAPEGGADGTVIASLPADGVQATLPTSDPGALKIVFVPIQNGDSLPETSPDIISYLTDAMMATYPVAKIEATVRAPMDFPQRIATYESWDLAVNQLCILRANDRPARNVFYYGLVTPGPLARYRGELQGISLAVSSNPDEENGRCAMGLGYPQMGSTVFMHEMGHAMGRSHAPCGAPADADPAFPYPGAKIGVWGYDQAHQRLIDPLRTSDLMSYCVPAWISDYTYSHLFSWIQTVNQLPPLSAAATRGAARRRVATVQSDGNVVWGPLVDFKPIVGGVPHTVVLRDGQGAESTISGVLFPHTHTSGGMLLLPATVPTRVSALKLGADPRFRPVHAL